MRRCSSRSAVTRFRIIGQLLRRSHGVRRQLGQSAIELIHQVRDTHHKEFIQIVADDLDETNSLEEGVASIACLGKQALLILEQTDLAIDVKLRRSEIYDFVAGFCSIS